MSVFWYSAWCAVQTEEPDNSGATQKRLQYKKDGHSHLGTTYRVSNPVFYAFWSEKVSDLDERV